MAADTTQPKRRFDFWLTAAVVAYCFNLAGWAAFAVWRITHG
jgi:hypothetical protein